MMLINVRGSVVHTALAPVATELVQYEIQHEYDLRDTFPWHSNRKGPRQ